MIFGALMLVVLLASLDPTIVATALPTAFPGVAKCELVDYKVRILDQATAVMRSPGC